MSKQGNRRKARQHVKISSRFNQAIPCSFQTIVLCLMPFDDIRSRVSLRAGSLVGKGGGTATASRQSRREEWGEEKWACTRAIDFWIPGVRWRTQRSDWLKMTGDKIQCNINVFHVTLPWSGVSGLCSERSSSFQLIRSWSDIKQSVNCSREGRDVSLWCRPVSLRVLVFSCSPQRSNRRKFRKEGKSEQCDFSYLTKMRLTDPHDFYGSWHLYIFRSLFGHSTFFVNSRFWRALHVV